MKEKTLKNKICDIKNKTSPAAAVLFLARKQELFLIKRLLLFMYLGKKQN